MSDTAPFAIALDVCGALKRIGVPFHLGGSLASSIHGFPRATLDADVVADLRIAHSALLVAEIGPGYYASEPAIELAIADRACFHVIHLGTMFKVDVFVCGDGEFDRESFARRGGE